MINHSKMHYLNLNALTKTKLTISTSKTDMKVIKISIKSSSTLRTRYLSKRILSTSHWMNILMRMMIEMIDLIIGESLNIRRSVTEITEVAKVGNKLYPRIRLINMRMMAWTKIKRRTMTSNT
jgi:hypothetical protein